MRDQVHMFIDLLTAGPFGPGGPGMQTSDVGTGVVVGSGGIGR